jgi:hypothetical protein
MLGKIVGHREIAARWSYAEITGRFASAYIQNHQDSGSVALISKIRNGASFDNLDGAERERLALWFDTGYRRDFPDRRPFCSAGALDHWALGRRHTAALGRQFSGRIIFSHS